MDQLDALCALLHEEATACSVLAASLREEQQAMVALQPQRILRALGNRRAVQDGLARLASRRRDLVREVARDRGVEAASATELLVGLPPDRRGDLFEQLRTLRWALLEVRGIERQNALLARASLQHTEDLLSMLRGLVPGARFGDARLVPPARLATSTAGSDGQR